jgi:hypothetical protein
MNSLDGSVPPEERVMVEFNPAGKVAQLHIILGLLATPSV